MKTTESIANLSKAYVAAQADLKNAAFDKENPHFKSRYATLAGVRDAVAPILSKHGLAVLQGTDVRPEGLFIITRLLHSSGEWIESMYPFAVDKPQQMGSAMTYARRYCMSAICGIASEEDDDGNEGQKGEQKPAVSNTPGNFAQTKTATRDDFQRLCRELEAITRLPDLQTWRDRNLVAIENLNDDLKDNFRNSYIDKQRELKATLAA